MYKRTKGEKVLYAIIFLLFAAYALSMIVPFARLLVNSLQNHIIYDINKANGSIFTLPKKLYFDNYIFSFQKLEANGSNIFAMFFNSVWYVAAYVGGSVLMSAFTGYALSKYKFKLGGMIYAIIIFSMTVPTTGTTGATFKLVNDILNIYDTPLYVILKHLNGTGLNFLIMYGFFRNVSWSYAEAGFIDGASHTKVFFQIMLCSILLLNFGDIDFDFFTEFCGFHDTVDNRLVDNNLAGRNGSAAAFLDGIDERTHFLEEEFCRRFNRYFVLYL